ncbi:hypothetical protein [Brumimicrobium oceani]|uniref:CcmD family protein n=1 Tax=Brumimicrobium oceani TaxID=2100725 RepID=A0A2U2XEX0_9FLAO|nr:hypothetical protein [Brumimicrobium oceani]PWH86251.1 hypothetical protein DIT68_03145 [Brumimicrobium oceani]
MMTKIYLLLATIWMTLATFAQTPQHVTQTDSEQVNFWESDTAMIIGGVLILALIIARTWSKRIHKRRDEVISEDEEK